MKDTEPEYTIARSPNFSSRRDTKIDCVVLYGAGKMALQPVLRWLQTKECGISAHFVIPRHEEEGIIEMVPPEKKAWHAGRALMWRKGDVNLYSIGVQLIGTKESDFTDWQYEACSILCADLMNREPKILMNRIVGHDSISEREMGPGRFWKWDVFFDLLVEKLYGLPKRNRGEENAKDH